MTVCFGCARVGHSRNVCPDGPTVCNYCQGPHASVLCANGPGGTQRESLSHGARRLLDAETARARGATPSSSGAVASSSDSSNVDWCAISTADITAAYDERMANLRVSSSHVALSSISDEILRALYAEMGDPVPSLASGSDSDDEEFVRAVFSPISSALLHVPSPVLSLASDSPPSLVSSSHSDDAVRVSTPYEWSISMRERQRLYHALHGNSSSPGKKSMPVQQLDRNGRVVVNRA